MAGGRFVGWERIVIFAIVGTAANIIADQIGLVDYLAGWLGYGK